MNNYHPISVILPVYNNASTIKNAVMSILNQSFKDFELLIIDDGSTDDLKVLINKIKDKRISYHKIEHAGLGGAINYGLSISRHNLIARMDSDDIAHPNRFEKQFKFIKENPEADIVSCHYAVFVKDKIVYTVRPAGDHCSIRKNLLLYSDIIHSGVIYNKNIFEEVNPFPSQPFEDYSVWLKYKDRFRFAVVPEILMYYRLNAFSYSRENILEKYKLHYKIQDEYYSDEGIAKFSLNETEKLYYRGFREYFYGDKNLARKYWNKLGLNILSKPRVIIAYILTFMSVKFVTCFKESRVKLRLIYIVEYFISDNVKARGTFHKLINNQYENS